jgi:hypothetical protein
VQAADKIDSANLTLDEVLHPEKYPYVLLSLTISNEVQPNEPYWNRLVELFSENDIHQVVENANDIHQVLENAEVKHHCQNVVSQNDRYVDFLREHTRLNQHVSITDFRPSDNPPGGNRFLVYSLFPESAVNVRIRYEDPSNDMVVVNVGPAVTGGRAQRAYRPVKPMRPFNKSLIAW